MELMVTLLRAVGPSTSLVLVGDADQLAPVGAGKPFAELVASRLVPTVWLRHIFRQAAGSMIVQGAHAVREDVLEGGEVSMPLEGMNEPRYPTLKGIMGAKKKEVKDVRLADLGLAAPARAIEVVGLEALPPRPPGRILTGDPQDMARELVRALREDVKAI